MLITILSGLLLFIAGAASYIAYSIQRKKAKYSVATVKRWWEEEYEDSGTMMTRTRYELEFMDTSGITHNTTHSRKGSNQDGSIENQDEWDITYELSNKQNKPQYVTKVSPPSKSIALFLALIFFGIYLLGFPLFNRVLVWLLPTTH